MVPNVTKRLRHRLGLPALAASIVTEAELQASAVVAPMHLGIQSPDAWQQNPNTLQSVVWADVTGNPGPLTRGDAIAIPALARQRHLLCGVGAGCPLVVVDGPANTPAAEQPLWTSRTDGQLSPWHRMLWTIDDLMFHGWSLWRATRGYRQYATAGPGPLLTGERIPTELWDTDAAGRIRVGGEYVSAGEVILIPGPHEGILNMAPGALRRTIANLDAAANAARNPSAYLELHYTGDDQLTDEQIDAHIARWARARKGENGGVSWTNKVLEVKEHGTHQEHLLIEGRNADAVDMSRLVSSPSAMADATAAGASLTYETTEGRNSQFLDYGAGLYMAAVAARLSMDDIVPRGQRTAFDTSALTAKTIPTTGPKQDD